MQHQKMRRQKSKAKKLSSVAQQKNLVRKMTQNLYKKNSQSKVDDYKRVPERQSEDNQEEELPPRFLYPKDPNSVRVQVVVNTITKDILRQENISQLAIHFSQESQYLQKDSDELKIQEEIQEEKEKNIKEIIETHNISKGGYQKQQKNLKEEKEAIRILRNKFNYNEVSVQSNIKLIRERGVSTCKPSLKNFCGEVNQSLIFKAYMEFCKENKLERMQELGLQKKIIKEEKNEEEDELLQLNESQKITNSNNNSTGFNRALKIMERMIVQNKRKDQYRQFKYIFTKEKPELSRLNTKLLYPLWRIEYIPNRKYHVTGLAWNPKYSDLFATCYGSYEFALFSLKNTEYPEKVIHLETAAQCLHFHPSHPALLAVGLNDGNVMVFDIRRKSSEPVYKSSIRSKKHSDPVWQIQWNNDDQKLNFYTISSDGKIFNWLLMKDQLECEEIYRLKLYDKKNKKQDSDCSLVQLGSGLCFDFSPVDQFSFLVGTEEGNIHLCCSAYSGDYQETYEGHQLAVYKVRFNPFDAETFLSASADWSIKLWNINCKQPLLVFELNQSMVDVIWSPFESSVFIGLSLEKSYVFDLRQKRHLPIYENRPIKTKCTNLAINWEKPILLVGDYLGGVSTFKISDKVVNPDQVQTEEYKIKQVEELKKYIKMGSMIDQFIQH